MGSTNFFSWRGMIMVALSLSLGTGCAAKKLAVRNADILLQRQITKRLPLSSAQEKGLNQDVKAYLLAHQTTVKTLLPIIGSFEFQEGQGRIDEGELRRTFHTLWTFYETLAQSLFELLSNHLAHARESQQKTFLESFSDQTRQDRYKERDKKWPERFRFFFGSINETQIKIIEAHLKQDPVSDKLALQQEFKTKLQKILQGLGENKAEEISLTLMEYFRKSQKARPLLDLLIQIAPSLDQKQKNFFKQRRHEFIEILEYYLKTSY